MYCRKCGSRMGQNDSFCRVCGEVATEKSETKQPETYPPEESAAETAGEILSAGEASADDNIKEETGKVKDDGGVEFTWNVYEFPRPKKTEDIDFHWNIGEEKNAEEENFWRELESIAFQDNSRRNTNAENTARITEEELFRDMCEDREKKRQETNFFTFTKKNEEFQKLLDREYEKIRGKRPVKPPAPLSAEEEEKRRGINRNTIPISPRMTAEVQLAAATKEIPIPSKEEAAAETEPKKEVPEGAPEPGRDDGHAEPLIAEAGNKSLPLSCISSAQEKPEKTKGTKARRILLAVLIIVLILEVGAIGIQHFFPDTAAGRAVSKIQRGLAFGILKSEDSSQNEAMDTAADSSLKEQNSESEPEVPVIDTNPAADKEALIASQMKRNQNIQTVRPSSALGYRAEKDYGLSGINHSVPLENNLLMVDNQGNPIYIDQEAVGTLIAFDSQWIDYVNTGNTAVFDLLEEGSAAYKNSKAYSQAGKIKETFVLLEIGEIRQGADGFYVWTHEQIQIEKNGSVQSKEYYWIYLLRASGGQMKIADYKRY